MNLFQYTSQRIKNTFLKYKASIPTFNWQRKLHHSLFIVGILVITGLTISFTLIITENLLVYKNYKKNEAVLKASCALAKQTYQQQENYLNHLTHDPEFRERVVRDQLEYVRANEVIFKFHPKATL